MGSNITNFTKEENKMEIGTISLITAIGKVVVVGSVSMLCNTLISYHHFHKAKKSSAGSSTTGGGKRNVNKSPRERMQELREISEAE